MSEHVRRCREGQTYVQRMFTNAEHLRRYDEKLVKARGPQHHNGKIARYHGKTYGNISLDSGISWGLVAPRHPHGFPRVPGHWGVGDLKNGFWKS